MIDMDWWWDLHCDVARIVCDSIGIAVRIRHQFGVIQYLPRGWMAEEGSGVFCLSPVADCETGLYSIGVKFYAVRVPRVETSPCPEPHPPCDEEERP